MQFIISDYLLKDLTFFVAKCSAAAKRCFSYFPAAESLPWRRDVLLVSDAREPYRPLFLFFSFAVALYGNDRKRIYERATNT